MSERQQPRVTMTEQEVDAKDRIDGRENAGMSGKVDEPADRHCHRPQPGHLAGALTGTAVWTHPMNGDFWASPMVADGRIYLGTRKGNFSVLKAGRELKVLSNLELKSPISATVTMANGTAYLATREIVAVEIVRALVGSIGLVASVPISTALAAKVLASTHLHTQTTEPIEP